MTNMLVRESEFKKDDTKPIQAIIQTNMDSFSVKINEEMAKHTAILENLFQEEMERHTNQVKSLLVALKKQFNCGS